MTEPLTISPNPPENPGMDYAHLREEGVRILQDLTGEIWTDYNESDPGVTTLEQLCYALTELSYRAEMPLVDLLTGESGRIDPRRQALFPAQEIFPVNPVTVDDYRKLLIDRVPEVLNVWLHPRRPKGRCRVRGLYDVAVYMREAHACGEDEQDDVESQVRRVYAAHRNLAEDLRAIWILKPKETIVSADVTVAEGSRPEPLLADLYFSLGLLFAPEPRRRSLQSLLAAGRSPSEIFDGPMLEHGFFDDDQLCPKPSEIPMDAVQETILGQTGVKALADLKVRCGHRTYRSEDARIHVGRRRVAHLALRGRREQGFSIRLFRHGIEIEPDAARVERELAARWARHRRTYDLAAEAEDLLPFPRGARRDVRSYESVQCQYPAVYGIGEDGLPSDASEPRRAQALQLKGYLLAFDQLMADFFAQLSRVRDLYSTDEDLSRTYFFQYLDDVVPHVQPLLQGYREGLPELVASQDPVVRRRNRFSAFLLALYAESLEAADLWQPAPAGEDDGETEASGRRRLAAQLALLRRLVAATRDRGRGFDYLAKPSRGNRAGMEIKTRIELGMAPSPRSLTDVLEEWCLEPGEEGSGEPSAGGLQRYEGDIEEELEAVGRGQDEDFPEIDLPAALPSSLEWSEELLEAAARGVRVHLGELPGDSDVSVVWKPCGRDPWRRLARCPDRATAHRVCHAFHRLLHSLRCHGQQLWIVEHQLLRWGRWRRCEGASGDFDYDFTLTAVILTFPHLRRDSGYRRFVREVLRRNTPAHVAVDVCFLTSWNAFRFERRYWRWQRALRCGTRRDRRDASMGLRCFLERHGQHGQEEGDR